MCNVFSFRSRLLTSLALLALIAMPGAAKADTNQDYGPKPLLAAPSPTDTGKPKNPNAIPDNLIADRKQNDKDLLALLKEQQGVEAKCAAVHTPAERADCERQRQYMQTKLDAQQEKTRITMGQITNWRRQRAGLPPLDFSRHAPQAAPTTSGGVPTGSNNNSNGNKTGNGPLLPSSGTTLPANTF